MIHNYNHYYTRTKIRCSDKDLLAFAEQSRYQSRDGFMWSPGQGIGPKQDWALFYLKGYPHRLIDTANARIIESMFARQLALGKTMFLSSFAGCGTGYHLAIKVCYANGQITKSFERYYRDVHLQLEQYPLLDDGVYSEIEHETLHENIKSEMNLCSDYWHDQDQAYRALEFSHWDAKDRSKCWDYWHYAENYDDLGGYPDALHIAFLVWLVKPELIDLESIAIDTTPDQRHKKLTHTGRVIGSLDDNQDRFLGALAKYD